MTEKEKKAETARLEAEAKAKEAQKAQADADFEAEIDGLSEEEKEAKRAEREEAQNNDNSIDWKAELEKEKEGRKKAEKALADARFKDSEKKRKKREEGADDEDDDEPDDDKKPVTTGELKKIIAQTSQQTEKRLLSNQIKDIALSLAESEEEAEYIIDVYENRIFPEHLSLQEKLEEAHAIANRKRIKSRESELKRALKGKETSYNGTGGAHRDATPSPGVKVNAADKASYLRAGFEYDSTAKMWKKKLPNGKTLVKDPVTKRTFVQQ